MVKNIFKPEPVIQFYWGTVYLDINALKYRGWTDTLINRFLGDADQWLPVNHYANFQGKRAWFIARVVEAEQSDNFLKVFRTSLKRRKISKYNISKYAKNRKAQNCKICLEVNRAIENGQDLMMISSEQKSELAQLCIKCVPPVD